MKTKISTEYVSPPIPTRARDWRATWDHHDGDDTQPTGWGKDEMEAVASLLWDTAENGDEDDLNELVALALTAWRAAQ